MSESASPVDTTDAYYAVKAEILKREAGGKEQSAPHTIQKKAKWPPEYDKVLAWRQQRLAKFETDKELLKHAKAYYRSHPQEFINHWCTTYDPRNSGTDVPVKMPFIMFERQDQLIQFIGACVKGQESGLIEKSRDMGATWICSAYSVWSWLFETGSAVGWGSRKEQLVDKLGDPDSIFEKMRMLIMDLPRVFWPNDFKPNEHMHYMRIINPSNGATITGEGGDNIGRGGRKRIYFVDEAAHLERPEKVEAALLDNTRVRIDISSVNGLGNVFYRKRDAGHEWEPGNKVKPATTNVFVMDWSHHPAKTRAWYNQRRNKASGDGTLHIFAQEVDRDYAAAVEGIIIKPEWVTAAIDAHEVLGFDDSGGTMGGLDVADGGSDNNALAIRQGSVVKFLDEWGERDTGMTARRAVDGCKGFVPMELNYDSIGVGAGVKSETNRLKDDDLVPSGLVITPWNAGGKVQRPWERLNSDDENSPTNKDFYKNIKAQGWWLLARRFENTFRAVNEKGFEAEPEGLISLPSSLPFFDRVKKELSQATASRNSQMKIVVDKSPPGTQSPNLADAIVMAFTPIESELLSISMIAGPIVQKPDR